MSDDGYTATELGMLRDEAKNARVEIQQDGEREAWEREVDRLTKCECGHPYREHGANPPYTGYEWCEGDETTEWPDAYVTWACQCREYNGPDPDEVREQLLTT